MASARLGGKGRGRTAARLLPFDASPQVLRDAARSAFAKRAQIPVFRIAAPYVFELEVHNSLQAEAPALVAGVKRPSARTLTFTSDDYVEGFKLLRALIALAAAA